jgi:hypothetical protein
VYNLEVYQVHNYSVSEVGVLVHNLYDGKKRNGHLGGDKHPKTDVPFSNDGFPDFKGHLYSGGKGKNDVLIKPTYDRTKDFNAADQAAGYNSENPRPKGYTWHHHQDRGRMQLVETEAHRKTGHTGGFKIWD